MKTLQTIFNKIAEDKTELKTHKVELTLVGDIEKAAKKSDGLVKKSKKLVEKIEKAFKSYNDLWEKTRTESDEIEKQIAFNNRRIEDASTAAKELGVKVSDIKGVATLEEINKDLSREINLLKYPAIR
jgi:predicted  nucleic acid-binding Zn-ribbon protein